MSRILSPGLIFVFTVTVICFSPVLQEDKRQFPGSGLDTPVCFSLRLAMADGEGPLPPPGAAVGPMTSRPTTESEGQRPSSQDLEKISISYGLEKEFFTIQAASYPNAATAERGYAILEQALHGEDLDQLRIEVVGPYHALRIGAFEERAPARSLLRKVKKRFPSSLMLSAHINRERIIKIHDRPLALEEMPSFPGGIPATRNAPELTIEKEEEGAGGGRGISTALPKTGVSQSAQIESAAEATPMPAAPEEAGQIRAEATKPPPPIQEITEISKPAILPKDFSFKAKEILDKDDRARPFRYPSTVFYDQVMHEIYVVDSGRVLVFDAEYAVLVSFGKGRGVAAPQGLYVDKDGWVYVCQTQDGEKPPRLTILNPALFIEKEIILRTINGAESFTPERIARSHDGTLYLVGPNTRPGVLVLDRQGNFLRWLQAGDAEPGKRPVASSKPVVIKDIDIDDQGRIYLLSEETSKIYVYSPEEKFLFSFGQKGGSSGKTSRPRGLALDHKNGIIYVVDYMRHTILLYDFAGAYLREFGGLGYSAGWFRYPTDIAVDDQGRVIVADFFNQRVQILEMEVHN